MTKTDNSELIFNMTIIIGIMVVIGAICYASYQSDHQSKAQKRLKERLVKRKEKEIKRKEKEEGAKVAITESEKEKKMDKDEKTVRKVAKKMQFKEDMNGDYSITSIVDSSFQQ